MKACPQCSAELSPPGTSCAKCGWHAAGGETGPSSRREALFEAPTGAIPDLDVDIRAPAPSSVAPSARGPQIATAVPVLRGPQSMKPVADAVQARTVAKFPLPPDHIWEAPAYAREVKARVAELDVQLERRRAKYDAASRALTAELVLVAQQGVHAVERMDRTQSIAFVRTVDRLKEREKGLVDRDGAHVLEEAKHNEKLATLDAQLAQLADALSARQAEEKQQAAALAQKGKDPAKAPELEPARERVRETQRQLDAAHEARGLAELASPKPTKNPAAEKARKEYETACADFAQTVIDAPAAFGAAFDELRKRIKPLRANVAAAEKEVVLYEAARDCYDKDSVARGRSVVVGGGVLAAVIVLIVLRVLFG